MSNNCKIIKKILRKKYKMINNVNKYLNEYFSRT